MLDGKNTTKRTEHPRVREYRKKNRETIRLQVRMSPEKHGDNTSTSENVARRREIKC
jgi:hypothetical protein